MNDTPTPALARDAFGHTDRTATPAARRLMTAVTPGPDSAAIRSPVRARETDPAGDAESTVVRERRLSALQRANEVRLAMSEIRREISRGELEIDDALRDPRAQRMTIYDLLRARRRCGPRIARKILHHLQISERRRVEELTDRQRTLIAERLAVIYVMRRASDA